LNAKAMCDAESRKSAAEPIASESLNIWKPIAESASWR
jgi:hypothetical protein